MMSLAMKQHWPRILFVSAVSAVGGLANVGLLSLITSFATESGSLVRWLAFYGGGVLLLLAAYFSAEYLVTRFTGDTIAAIRKDLAERISSLSYERLEAIGEHRLYTTLATDVGTINHLLSMLPMLAYNLAALLFCLLFLGILSVPLLLVFLAFLVVCMVGFQAVIVHRSARSFEQLRGAEDALFSCYSGLIEGFKELQYNRNRKQRFYEHDLANASATYRERFVSARVYTMIANSWGLGLLFMAIGSILWLSNAAALLPKEDLPRVIMVILYVAGPIEVLMQSLDRVQQARVALNRLDTLELHADGSKGRSVGRLPFSHLELRGVTYSYIEPGSQQTGFTVGPVDLRIEHGQVVYLIGGNGSGKTTVGKLIGGLYRPEAGQVLLNGTAVDEDALGSYQELFSAVFSDYFLFDEAIHKHGEAIPDEQIEAMLVKLRLEDKVKVDSGRLSTINLSSGQRKRLALLLAYFDDGEIYLFDEWAAEQDPEFRAYFYEELLPELKARGKTSVVITHDDRYFHLADRLYKFERGRLSEPERLADITGIGIPALRALRTSREAAR